MASRGFMQFALRTVASATRPALLRVTQTKGRRWAYAGLAAAVPFALGTVYCASSTEVEQTAVREDPWSKLKLPTIIHPLGARRQHVLVGLGTRSVSFVNFYVSYS